MMARLRESRGFYALLSVLLALGFWSYVRNEEDPVIVNNLRNIPVEVTGMGVLTSQGLTVAEISQETVDLQVEGPTSALQDLARFRKDIHIPLDVSRCVEGENRVRLEQPVWPDNFNTDEITTLKREPTVVTVVVEKLYTSSFDIEFRLDGKVAQGYQMGIPAIEPSSVVVSGPVEQVNQVERVVAVLEQEELGQRFAGDLPLTPLDQEGEPITDLEIRLSADTAYVVVPIVVHRDVPLTVNVIGGGGATAEDAVVRIEPESIVISGEEEDIASLTQISVGSIDLSKVIGEDQREFPISLDPRLENISGETTATVTVTVEGLDTAVFNVSNISLTGTEGRDATAITQMKQITVRGKEEDLARLDASQLRIVADLSKVTATGQISVPCRVYLDAGSSLGVIGEYTIVVYIER